MGVDDGARFRAHVQTLQIRTDRLPHRDLMLPRFGFTDELRAALPARGVIWGGLAL